MANKSSDKIIIPHKKYFKIGEVAQLFNIEAHTLRFWEKQFTQLKPRRNRTSKHRTYTRRDVEIIQIIYHLVYEQNFTNRGAQQRLQELLESKNELAPHQSNHSFRIEQLIDIREDLESLRKIIDEL